MCNLLYLLFANLYPLYLSTTPTDKSFIIYQNAVVSWCFTFVYQGYVLCALYWESHMNMIHVILWVGIVCMICSRWVLKWYKVWKSVYMISRQCASWSIISDLLKHHLCEGQISAHRKLRWDELYKNWVLVERGIQKHKWWNSFWVA